MALEQIVARPEVKTVEDFLWRLPDYMRAGPGLTAAYQAHGQLVSSRQYPNFFLYGDNRSSIVLVYNSEPTSPTRTADEVEVLTFDRSSKKHGLARILFKAGEPPKIELHPAECIRCHGDNSKPLWRAGYHWPGFFGSEEDRLEYSEAEDFKQLQQHPGPRVAPLDLSLAYNVQDGRGNNNIALGGRLAAEHTSSLARQIHDNANYPLQINNLLYELSFCGDADSRVAAFARFGIGPQDWFLNIDALPDPGEEAFYAVKGQSFEFGLGPIEYLMLSQLIALDPSRQKLPFSRFIPHFVEAKVRAEDVVKRYSPEMVTSLLSPQVKKGQTIQKWCADFQKDPR